MKKVFVAMSGGVDSSVAAALLKKQGYEVTGVFFKPWQPDASPAFCNWQKDRQDAMAVAEVLEIPFKTWDFSKEYKKKVGDYMIESYRKGVTPNPDVMCNKEIKFGLFLKKALKEGADFIATGHYVRKTQVKSSPTDKLYKLLTAKDKNKDQSYFLWTLNQKQLRRCLFPIGDYIKPEVRKMAKKFGLPTFDKKDSQGVCFIGQFDMKEFLKKYIPSKSGPIILQEAPGNKRKLKFRPLKSSRSNLGTWFSLVPPAPLDEIIGTHEGAAYYTIGQRHGLNISNGGGPYYVSGKDVKKNLVFVIKDEKKLGENEITATNLNWINPVIHTQGLTLRSLKIKARYRTPAVPAKVIHRQFSKTSKHNKDNYYKGRYYKGRTFVVKASRPIRAVAPGQSVVFYRGQEMLGGGIIN